jgi:DNA replication and repair protein RecF
VLEQIHLTHFRNIPEASILPSPQLNLFLGENGSGKTSLLEAIYLLTMGRSFRARFLNQVIMTDKTPLRVVAKTNEQVPIGLEYTSKDGLQIRLNNAPLKRLSDLAIALPVQFIPPNCHAYFEEGPKFRRRMVDWGLFHVEHTFNTHWQSYKKALQQRNAAIKQKQSDTQITLWDSHLINHGEKITQLREAYLERLFIYFEPLYKRLCPEIKTSTFSLRYVQGWQKETSFAVYLGESLQRDKILGYTRSGPHAADWLFRIDGHNPSERLSRGQQKMFFIALCLAQVMLLSNEKEVKDSLLLIDDLSSELDEEHQKIALELLHEMQVQTFITSTNHQLETMMTLTSADTVFHVKHGQVLRVE